MQNLGHSITEIVRGVSMAQKKREKNNEVSLALQISNN